MSVPALCWGNKIENQDWKLKMIYGIINCKILIGGIGVELSFFQSLLFGFLSGLTDILPVSAQAHKTLLLTLFGTQSEPAVLRLAIHLAVLAALYISCRDQFHRISSQRKLARVPKRRRKRPLDIQVLMDYRLLQMMVVPVVVGYLFYQKAAALNSSLNWVALLALVNALILFLPNLMPSGNKDSRSLSPLEGLIMGVGGAVGVLPGISSMGGMLSAASVCGAEKKFAVNLALMVQMAATAVLTVFDVVALISGIGTLTVSVFLGYLAAAAAAFVGVRMGVNVMRKLSERTGFNMFAFYSLAVASLTFIFYLMV